MCSFIVQSNNQKTYSVKLFPKETCNCPCTTTCQNIIASKLSVGNHNVMPSKRTLNLSQLKRNSRKGPDKKSGRKQPQPNDTDVEIISAPDSHESTESTKKFIQTIENIKTESLDTCICNDLVNFESKADILSKGKSELQHLTNGILVIQWFTSDHMSNVNKLISKDGYSLHGFQDTLLS